MTVKCYYNCQHPRLELEPAEEGDKDEPVVAVVVHSYCRSGGTRLPNNSSFCTSHLS
jgi:hypothetical protein